MPRARSERYELRAENLAAGYMFFLCSQHVPPSASMPVAYDDPLTLTEEDDGKLFVVRVINTGEERVARFHFRALAGHVLRFPCFADPNHPEGACRKLWRRPRERRGLP